MLIRDILNLKGAAVHGAAPGTRVAAAVSEMVRLDIGSLVVLEGGAMAGLVTFREVLKALDARGGDLGQLTVGEIMVADPVCGAPGDTLDRARELMTEHHVRYLPVKEGGKLAGVISFHDIAKAAIKESSSEIRLLKRYLESDADSRKSQ